MTAGPTRTIADMADAEGTSKPVRPFAGDTAGGGAGPARPATPWGDASSRVEQVVDAAERAADELRRQAERRARERINEADRAAELRVEAAEREASEIIAAGKARAARAEAKARESAARAREHAIAERDAVQREAAEVIDAARAEAEQLIRATRDEIDELIGSAQSEADEIVGAAEHEADALRRQARGELAREKAIAEQELKTIRDEAEGERERILAGLDDEIATARAELQAELKAARDDSVKQCRQIVAEARRVAADVLEDGGELSTNLQQLSSSMRTNAERILRDTQQAHRALMAKLDAVSTPAQEDDRRGRAFDEISARSLRGRTAATTSLSRDDELGVPDFVSISGATERDFDIPEFLG